MDIFVVIEVQNDDFFIAKNTKIAKMSCVKIKSALKTSGIIPCKPNHVQKIGLNRLSCIS